MGYHMKDIYIKKYSTHLTNMNTSNTIPVTNPNPVVENQLNDTKIKSYDPLLRPLPEVDENELHCIYQPNYPLSYDQNAIVQPSQQPGTSNLGYTNTNHVSQGTGMAR
jgi:hypothetical protein